VIFMDHIMPLMDGVETTRHIRDFGYTHPIVALTANAMTENMEFFLDNGFDDVVIKPIDIRLLTSVLNRYVRDKQPPEVLEAARVQDNP
jgi:CheY-like chemotaxis protein